MRVVILIFFIQLCIWEVHAVAQLVAALRYKPMVSLEFFVDIILLAALWPWA
jgi:hypothetical protein